METDPRPVRPVALISHGKCGSQWSGTRTAHCGACCSTFSSLTAFDQHQRNVEPGELCRKPQDAGLVPVDRPWGVMWSCASTGAHPGHDAFDGDAEPEEAP
jgi:hypothetical protein